MAAWNVVPVCWLVGKRIWNGTIPVVAVVYSLGLAKFLVKVTVVESKLLFDGGCQVSHRCRFIPEYSYKFLLAVNLTLTFSIFTVVLL